MVELLAGMATCFINTRVWGSRMFVSNKSLIGQLGCVGQLLSTNDLIHIIYYHFRSKIVSITRHDAKLAVIRHYLN